MFSKQTCPYCGNKHCEADWVDVDVGFVQCAPYYCGECGSTEIGAHDTSTPTEEESKVGWYKGRIDPIVNTFNGVPVDHQTALSLYRGGVLDD